MIILMWTHYAEEYRGVELVSLGRNRTARLVGLAPLNDESYVLQASSETTTFGCQFAQYLA